MNLAFTALTLRPLLAGLGLLLAAAPAWAQAPVPAAPALAAPVSRYPAASIGLTLGYGAPYGWGADLSFMVLPRLDVNLGLGASITGGKVGMGTRYYFTPERKVSPFVGGNLVYSTGLSNVSINTSTQSNYGPGGYYANYNQLVVNFKSTALLHLRGGVRWQPLRRFAMLGALGYGAVLGPNAVEYVVGTPSASDRTLVNLFSPGGVELSAGLAFGLGRSY